MASATLRPCGLVTSFMVNDPVDLPAGSHLCWQIGTSITRLAYPSASPLRSPSQFRNIDRMSIDYAVRPRLRTD